MHPTKLPPRLRAAVSGCVAGGVWVGVGWEGRGGAGVRPHSLAKKGTLKLAPGLYLSIAVNCGVSPALPGARKHARAGARKWELWTIRGGAETPKFTPMCYRAHERHRPSYS